MSVTAAAGFVAGGLACGIKPSGAADLAIVATEDRAPVVAAGVFTSNLAQAAPVLISKTHLLLRTESGGATMSTHPDERGAYVFNGVPSGPAEMMVYGSGVARLQFPSPSR